ncbi:unnamed protein product [Acanthoscelides obtectus]|uniref:Uncharacterized protein n=1 Tax=Acanthoscelides obtectus TaxID=200917 RepID=A0A9P0NVY6_ACAOB|nr:unnamed protein product [Acanthoscelides obtectus]CAK1658027.1 hypothetical protein AOBTE_LOCUS20660 [Acanthoscelides obtectus]
MTHVAQIHSLLIHCSHAIIPILQPAPRELPYNTGEQSLRLCLQEFDTST